MPPRLVDYGMVDWLRLRPLLHRLKTRRYRAIDRSFRRQPARAGDVAHLRNQIAGRRTLITIGFNDAQTISWQASLVKRNVADVIYIVADNSADEAAASDIAALAARRHIPYVRLPQNPVSSPSRSHALALNWVWENIVKPGEPDVFGFIDDDIYPTKPDNPFAALSDQSFFGVVRSPAPGFANGWFLWAGFCMFSFARVKQIDLDFSQDWFCGLDTGGANWDRLYSRFDRFSLREQSLESFPIREGLTTVEAPLQWCGPWLHTIGHAGDPKYAQEKADVLARIIEPLVKEAELAERSAS